MQVQKLVFLAQGYSLAILGHCIFEKHIHAWQWGPVIPPLYKALRKYGNGVVRDTLASPDEVTNVDEKKIIDGVWAAYRNYSGGSLSELTHRPNSPWDRAWKREQFSVIDTEDIRAYYSKLVTA